METANAIADNPGTQADVTSQQSAPDYSSMGNSELANAMAEFIAQAQQPAVPEASTQQQDQQTESAEPQPEPEPGVQIPDKFRNPDGSVNVDALTKSYVNLESAYHQRNQAPPEWQQENEWLKTQLNNLIQAQQSGQQQPGEGQAEQQSTEQQVQDILDNMSDEQRDEWFETFYANPGQAMKQMMAAMLQPIQQVIQPIQQSMEHQAKYQAAQQELNALAQKYGDIQPVLPYMQQVLEQMPGADQLSTELVFDLAMGRYLAANYQQQQQQSQSPAMTPEQMAADPAVRQLVLSQHIQGLKQNAPPVVMGSQPGQAGMPASPSKGINSIKDATPAMEAFLRQAMNGG